MLVGFKLGKQVFYYPVVDHLVGGGIPYDQSISDDIHKIRIDRMGRHDDMVGG